MNSIIEAQIELKEQQRLEWQRFQEAGLVPIYEITDKGIRESYRYKFKPSKDER